MNILPILHWPDARLATKCEPIEDPTSVADLVETMLDTMDTALGRVMAAPQVGVLTRVFVMNTTWKKASPTPLICINPEIVMRSENRVKSDEGCLSMSGIVAPVTRHAEITLRWQGGDGTWQERHLTGIKAICAQHELDHLDGVVLFDRLDAITRAVKELEFGALV